MNCKEGDLAVIFGSKTHPMCNGVVVSCVSLARGRKPTWNVSGHEIARYAAQLRMPLVIFDERLRPIRDSDGTDEMLRIAGLPKRDEVKA